MSTHQCTLKELELKKLEQQKKEFLKPPKERGHKVDPATLPADYNNYIFDKNNLKIVKKGQMKLL